MRKSERTLKTLRDWARAYQKAGYGIVPQYLNRSVPGGWKQFQKHPPSADYVIKAWCRTEHANIALICGQTQGIFVVDTDSAEAERFIQDQGGLSCPTVKSKRGYHYIFEYPDFEISTQTDVKGIKLDVLAEKHLAILPPSLHKSRKVKYSWVGGIHESLLYQKPGKPPPWLLKLLKKYCTAHRAKGDGKTKKYDRFITAHDIDKLYLPNVLRNENIEIKAVGKQFKAICPFHTEDDPSFCIYQDEVDRWCFKCHGCGVFGDTVGFIRKYYKYSFNHALYYLGVKKLPPVAIDKLSALKYPEWVMDGAAGEFARTYSQYLEVPQSFLYMSFLTALGTTVSESITLDSELHPQSRLYTVLIGESADTRKSTAINKVVDLFKTSIERRAGRIIYGLGSAEGLGKAIEKEEHEVEQTRNLLLVIDELKSFVQKSKIEGSTLLPCVNTLFERNDYQSFTKTRSIDVKEVYLNILSASTLETYQTMFSHQFLNIGFTNRLFVVLDEGQKKFPMPVKVPRQAKEKMEAELQKILETVNWLKRQRDRAYPLPYTKKAYGLFEEYYFSTPRSIFTKRLDTYGHRLMILLALNENKKRIDTAIMQKVIALLDYELSVRQQVDPIDADTKIATVQEKIRRTLSNSPLEKRGLERKVNKWRYGPLWNSAINYLVQDEEIFFDKRKKVYYLTKDA